MILINNNLIVITNTSIVILNEEKIIALNEIKEKEELIIKLKQQNKEEAILLDAQIKNKEKHIDKLSKQCQDSLEKITILNIRLKNKDYNINKLQQQTDELKRQLNEETEKYQNSQSNFKKEISALLSQIQTQQTVLSGFVNNVYKKYDFDRRGKLLVNNILKMQRDVIITNDNYASKILGIIRRQLIREYKLTEEDIRNILYKQAEKTKLDMQLESIVLKKSLISLRNTRNDQSNRALRKNYHQSNK